MRWVSFNQLKAILSQRLTFRIQPADDHQTQIAILPWISSLSPQIWGSPSLHNYMSQFLKIYLFIYLSINTHTSYWFCLSDESWLIQFINNMKKNIPPQRMVDKFQWGKWIGSPYFGEFLRDWGGRGTLRIAKSLIPPLRLLESTCWPPGSAQGRATHCIKGVGRA